MNTNRSVHYSFKQNRTVRVHLVGGSVVEYPARSAREATDIATAEGHDVAYSMVAR